MKERNAQKETNLEADLSPLCQAGRGSTLAPLPADIATAFIDILADILIREIADGAVPLGTQP